MQREDVPPRRVVWAFGYYRATNRFTGYLMPAVSVKDLLSAKKHLALSKWVNLVRKGNRMALGHAGKEPKFGQQSLLMWSLRGLAVSHGLIPIHSLLRSHHTFSSLSFFVTNQASLFPSQTPEI